MNARTYLLALAAFEFLRSLLRMYSRIIVAWWLSSNYGVELLAGYVACVGVSMVIAVPLASPAIDRRGIRYALRWASVGMFIEAVTLCAAIVPSDKSLGYALLPLLAMSGVGASALLIGVSSIAPTHLLSPSLLDKAFSQQKAAQSIGRMAGPAFAGLVLASGSLATAAILQVALVLFMCTASLQLARTSNAQMKPAEGIRSWYSDARSGFVAKWSIPLERNWTICSIAANVLHAPAIGILIPALLIAKGQPAYTLAVAEGALSAGMLLASLGVAQLLCRRLGRGVVSIGGMLAEAVLLILVGLQDSELLLFVALLLIGLSLVSAQLASGPHRILAAPERYRARFSAANFAAAEVAAAGGTAIAGGLLSLTSPTTIYATIGCLLMLVALRLATLQEYRALLALSQEDAKGYYSAKHPELFR